MLPDSIARYSLDGRVLYEVPRPPAAAEVVIAVAGSALGAAPGREVAGTVVAAGDAAAHWVGRRVVAPRVLPCGDCELCRRGRAAACPAQADRAGLASHETVPARYLLSVEAPLWPDGEELWRLAALADAAAAPYGALTRAGVAPGELVVVVGAGARGAFAVALARALGAWPVVVEADAARAARAIDLGARAVISPELAPDEARVAVEREAAAAGVRAYAWKLVETTATAAGRLRALAMLPAGGTAALLDGGDDLDGRAAPWARLAALEAQVIGAAAAHPDLLPELCALVVRKELPLAPLVAAVAPAEIATAIAARRSNLSSVLPILRP
jgi:6-hydroxycyclohex-1-ene-1-carbonyl-CoA dehydrogenase